MASITGTVLTSGGVGTYDSDGSDFDILRDLLVTADATASEPYLGVGLVTALDTVPDLTVWAPNDDAFTGLAATVGAVTGNDVPAGEEGTIGFLADTLTLLGGGNPNGLLTDILTYHVTPGVFDLNAVLGLGDDAAVPTLLGQNLTTDFDTSPASLIDGDSVVGNPGIIATDLFADNGVIHTIDGVLLPLEVASILTAPDTDFKIGDGEDNFYSTGAGVDFVDGNGGDDIIFGGNGKDVLIGGADNDLLLGQKGKDTLLGEDGSDNIFGGKGKDLIEGGSGDDWLTGGRGQDTFVFKNGSEDDTIVDFRTGKDMIDLSAYEGIESFSDIAHDITDTGVGAMIELGEGDSIHLLDVSGSALTESDFMFA